GTLGSAAVAPKTVAIIGAALDLGQGRRGVDMGPSALRYADLEERLVSLGYEVRDLGNVQTAEPEATAMRDETARYLPEILAACAQVAVLGREAVQAELSRLVLRGAQSIALDTVCAVAT